MTEQPEVRRKEESKKPTKYDAIKHIRAINSILIDMERFIDENEIDLALKTIDLITYHLRKIVSYINIKKGVTES